MSNKSRKYLLRIYAFLLLASLLAGLFNSKVQAQSRALPKAGFNNYSGSPLPSASGVSLQEGRDRPKGAPAEVYNPGEPTLGHKLVRWESRFMPLKIWISPGKKLAEEPISQINASRPQEVISLLKREQSLSSLSPCTGWTDSLNSAVKAGIEQWREFQNEGLISFDFVESPAQADILVFWTERFSGDEGAGGVSTAGNTVAVLYDAAEVRSKEASYGRLPGAPVIIELQVNSDSFDRLQARAAHEFGHALGIKEHSPYNQDLMCVNGIARTLSASDRATLRWLYRQQPQYVMLPPILPKTSESASESPSGKNIAETGSESVTPSVSSGSGYRMRFGSGQTRASSSDTADSKQDFLPAETANKERQRSRKKSSQKKIRGEDGKSGTEPETSSQSAETQAKDESRASDGY